MNSTPIPLVLVVVVVAIFSSLAAVGVGQRGGCRSNWGRMTDEKEAFDSFGVFNALQLVQTKFRARYPCKMRAFEQLTYRFQRLSKDQVIILVRGIVTTEHNIEDFVHLEIWDNRLDKKFELVNMANGKRERDSLPERLVDNVRPCPSRHPDDYDSRSSRVDKGCLKSLRSGGGSGGASNSTEHHQLRNTRRRSE